MHHGLLGQRLLPRLGLGTLVAQRLGLDARHITALLELFGRPRQLLGLLAVHAALEGFELGALRRQRRTQSQRLLLPRAFMSVSRRHGACRSLLKRLVDPFVRAIRK